MYECSDCSRKCTKYRIVFTDETMRTYKILCEECLVIFVENWEKEHDTPAIEYVMYTYQSTK